MLLVEIDALFVVGDDLLFETAGVGDGGEGVDEVAF